jgi:hypothetical protein
MRKAILSSSCLSVLPPVRPSVWNNSAPTGLIFMTFDMSISENLWRKFKFCYNLPRITGNLHEDRCTFISPRILPKTRNVSDKNCRENQNTRLVFQKFLSENRAVYEIMWKNMAKPDKSQMTIWRTCFSCWIPKATNTHSEYVILIAFPLQQWLHERSSMLRYTYITCRGKAVFIGGGQRKSSPGP